MPKFRYDELTQLATKHGFKIDRDGNTLSVFAKDGDLVFTANKGQKLTGAMAAINTYLQGSGGADVETLGSIYPLTYQLSNSHGASLQERFYDQEIPDEIPVRNNKQARQLQEMFCDGGLLETAVCEIVDSCVASSDGDDRGWVISDTVLDRPIKPEVQFILSRLYEEVIGGAKLNGAIFQMLQYGDAFGSIGLDFAPNRLGRIATLEWLPPFEMFRIEKEEKLPSGGVNKETYFEQRRYLSDEYLNQMPFWSIVHFRFRHKGKKYGNALFSGDACYRYWRSLRDAESDLAIASRNVGVTPLEHIFPANYSQDRMKAYRNEIARKRSQDGIITDYFLPEGGKIGGVAGIGGDLSGLINAVDHWRKVLATQSRVPVYLLGVKTEGAQDLSQQPALAYARLLNSLRADVTVGIRHLCDLELMLHGLDPRNPENGYEILWPKIVINSFEEFLSDESDQIPDTEDTTDPITPNLDPNSNATVTGQGNGSSTSASTSSANANNSSGVSANRDKSRKVNRGSGSSDVQRYIKSKDSLKRYRFTNHDEIESKVYKDQINYWLNHRDRTIP